MVEKKKTKKAVAKKTTTKKATSKKIEEKQVTKASTKKVDGKEITKKKTQKKVKSEKNTSMIIWGILSVILGMMLLGTPVFTTYFTILFLGWMLVFSGFINLFSAFSSNGKDVLIRVIFGILVIVLGFFFIFYPETAASTITLMVGVMFLIGGLSAIVHSFDIKGESNWEVPLILGILTIVLGFFLVGNWPVNSEYVLGIYVGLYFISQGTIQIMEGYE